MKLRISATLILISVLTSGCASTGGFKYIYPTAADRHISRSLKEQIVEHNEFCDKMGTCSKPDETKKQNLTSRLGDLLKGNWK